MQRYMNTRHSLIMNRSIAYNNASYFYSKGKGKAMPALVELRSVFGDDFALICMVGNETFF